MSDGLDAAGLKSVMIILIDVSTCVCRNKGMMMQVQVAMTRRNKQSVLFACVNIYPLLQNMFVVSAGKISFVSTLQIDTIYTIRKRRFL
jgi:uncharacterized pyridoxamine 5'-phosphate oxidase family protein